jgi:mono/diheme cytochrome c family protein
MRTRTLGTVAATLLLLMAGCGAPPADEAPTVTAAEPAAPSPAERGAYLVEGIAGCGNCHTPRTEDGEIDTDMILAGGFVIEEPEFTAYAPNITSDEATGIGSWTDEEIGRAIHEGVHPDGHILGPPMSFAFYRGISDNDIDAIVAYLRTVPAVSNEVPRSEFNIPLPEAWGPPMEPIADVSPADLVDYGAYLAGPIGHCTDCHTPLVEGTPDMAQVGAGGNVYENPFGLELATFSSNITPHEEDGIGTWTDDEIKRAISEGVSQDGRELAPFMGFPFYANISDEDLDAIVAYLRSLDPLPNP